MKKRILALVLTVVMLLSMVPTQVFAAQTETATTEQTEQSVQTQQSMQTQQSTETQQNPQSEDTPDILTLLDKELKEEVVMKDMEYLTETLGIRYTGTQNELDAQAYVAAELELLGYDVSTQEITLTQPTQNAGLKTKNVIAVKKASRETDLTIYISAHIDSVYKGPGANDDASGIAGMLALARAFKTIETNYNIVFLSFCAEEYGLQGSKHFANNLTEVEKANAIANYNLDMIATSDPDCNHMLMMSASQTTTVDGETTYDNHTTLTARNTAGTMGYGSEHFAVIYGTNADHNSFQEAGIPSAVFFWNKNTTSLSIEENYHTANDSLEKNFSIARMRQLLNVVARTVYNEATTNYVAVVGDGASRKYFTTMEAALEAAGDDEKVSTLHRHHGLNFGGTNNLDYLLVDGDSAACYLTDTVTAESYLASYFGDLHICLNGKDIAGTTNLSAAVGEIYIYDCAGTDKGTIDVDDVGFEEGNLHLVGGTLSLSEDYEMESDGSTFYLEGGELTVASGVNLTDGVLGYASFDSFVLKSGTISAPNGGNPIYHDGSPSFTMDGDIKLVSTDDYADILLTGANYKINIGSNFNPKGKTYTVAYNGEIPADGLQITNGWNAAKTANGIKDIPFVSFDDAYAVLEKNGELYLGEPPHECKDVPDVSFDTPISGEISGSFAPGAYYLTGNVKLTSNISLGSVGDVYICLNGFSVSGSNGRKSIDIEGSSRRLYICDCDETGHLEVDNVAIKDAELHLLGGEIDVYNGDGMKVSNDGSKIVFNGATVNFAATSSTAATVYVPACQKTPQIILLSGTINSKTGLGVVAHIGGGLLRMGGDIELNGTGNVPDFYLGDYVGKSTARLITIDNGFLPSGGRSYSVYVDPAEETIPADGYQITSGWGVNRPNLDYIPFVAVGDYAVVERTVNGVKELYIVPCKDEQNYQIHSHNGVSFDILLDQETANGMLPEDSNTSTGGYGIEPLGGSYILTEDVKITGILLGNFQAEHRTINICLHGHDITMEGYASTWSPSTLNIYDCKGTGKIHTDATAQFSLDQTQGAALWVYDTNSTVNLYSGNISSAGDFGILAEGGNTNLFGGSVSGKEVAVCVRPLSWDPTSVGTLNISGDPVLNGTVADIYLDKDVVVNIVGNLTPPEGETYTVKVSDEELAELQATKGMRQITSGWGTMKEKPKEIPFVYHEGDYNIVPKTVDGVTELYLVPPHSHTVSTNCHPGTTGDPNVTFTTKLTQSTFINTWTDSMNVVLMSDITATDNITVTDKVNLCLNGYTLDLGNYQIRVSENAELSICDCNGSGSATGGQILADNPFEGVIRALSGSTLRIHGGTIIATETYGVNFSGSTMEMTGGAIRQMDDQQALRIESGNVKITGGTLSYEGTNKKQHAVYIMGGVLTLNGADAKIQAPNGGMGITTDSSGKAILTKGTITASHMAVNNKATLEINGPVNITSTNDRGIENNGTATISAGTITGTNYGINQNGKLMLFGNPVINGGSKADINLHYGKDIALSDEDELEGTDTYSVSVEPPLLELEQREITEDWFIVHNDVTKWPFTSYNTDYEIIRGEYELYLYNPHKHAMSVDCETSGDKVIEFTPLSVPSGAMTLENGNYVLTGAASTNGGSITVKGNVNLCLNGKSLNLGNGKIEVTNGATLNICDCVGTGMITGSAEKTINVQIGGTLNLFEGKIENINGNQHAYSIMSLGSTNLYGGELVSAQGGVSANGGTVKIESENLTITAGASGVFVMGTFYLSGSPVINGGAADIKLGVNKVITIDGAVTPKNGETYSIVTNSPITAQAPKLTITSQWSTKGGESSASVFTHVNPTYTIEEEAGELILKGHVHYMEDGSKILYDTALTQDVIDKLEKIQYDSLYYYDLPPANYLLVQNITTTRQIEIRANAVTNICLCAKTFTSNYGATEANPSIMIDNSATLRIDDCPENVGTEDEKIGTLIFNWIGPMGNSFGGQESGSLILAGGKLLSNKNAPGLQRYRISLSLGGSFLMEGGVLEADQYGYYNMGSNTETTILGGTISADVNAIYLQYGKVYMEGNPVLKGNSADIWFESSGQYISFRQEHPLAMPSEAYTLAINQESVGTPTETNRIRITDGWVYSGLSSEDNGGVAKIPFVSTQGYAIREITEGGVKELYLVIPEVTVKYDNTKGNASATPQRTTEGNPIVVKAEPIGDKRVSAITWSYWDGTKTVTKSIDVSDAGEGETVERTFTMPAADVTVTVEFRDPHKHDGQTFEPITGPGPNANEPLNIYSNLIQGGAFYLDGEGDFQIYDSKIEFKPASDLYLCLNGKTLYLNQIESTGNIFICDCSGEGIGEGEVLNYKSPDEAVNNHNYWINNGGTITFKRIKFTSANINIWGDFASNPGKFVFEDSYITSINNDKTINFNKYGAHIEVRNSTIINTGNGYAVDIEVPTFILDGYSKIDSANKADIRLSYQHNNDDNVTIIEIGKDFNPAPEGKPALEYTFELYGVKQEIKEGVPLRITNGWGESIAGKAGQKPPFILQKDPDDPTDDDYEVFEMLGEIWVGIPHKHYDEDGKVIATYYFHVDKTTKEQYGWTWNEGYYFLTDKISDATEGQNLYAKGEVHLCLNDHTIENTRAHVEVDEGATLVIDDCCDEGIANFISYRSEHGTLKLLGGTIKASDHLGGFGTYSDNAEIIVDGATLISTTTDDKTNPTIYGHSGGKITLLSGEIYNQGPEGPALLLYSGEYHMGGPLVLEGAGNTGDIYMYTRKYIYVDGVITPAGDETYSIEVTDELAATITLDTPLQITIGFTENGNTVNPFRSHDPKFTCFVGEDGEVYLGLLHEHYMAVNTNSGEALADGKIPEFVNFSRPINSIKKLKVYPVAEENREYDMVGNDEYGLDTGSYVLTADLTLDKFLSIRGDVNLCLNGHKLDLGDNAITFNTYGNLNICDCKGGGIITTTNYNSTIRYASGTLNLYGGTIDHPVGYKANNKVYDKDGKLILPSAIRCHGTLNVYGGTIHSYHHGIYTVNPAAEVKISGGTIDAEVVASEGEGGSGIYASECNTIVIDGEKVQIFGKPGITALDGDITIKQATITSYASNGIFINGGNVTVEDKVTVKGRFAAIHLTTGALNLSGGPTITSTHPDKMFADIHLEKDMVINVIGKITGTYSVNTTQKPVIGKPVQITEDWEKYHSDDLYAFRFTSFDTKYFVFLNPEDKDLYLGCTFEVPLNVYMWKGHSVTAVKQMIIDAIADMDSGFKTFIQDSDIEIIEFRNMNDTAISYTFDGESLTFTGEEKNGTTWEIFVVFKNNTTKQVAAAAIPVVMNVYEVKDSVFVLDYAKAVKISDSIYAQDTLPGVEEKSVNVLFETFASKAELAENGRSMTITSTNGKGTYGAFTITDGEAIYTPYEAKMLEGSDIVYGVFRVYDKDATASAVGTINPFKEVEMFKEITMIPANVVYYEDDHAALTWNSKGVDITIEPMGEASEESKYQDGDNNSPYGNDSDYTYVPNGTYYGSGGYSKKIIVNASGPILEFTFTGTGFDLLGSTTADSGQFMYKITKDGTSIKSGSLNTVFKGSGEKDAAIYEVPLLHVVGLEHGTYSVLIQSVVSYDWSKPKDENGKPPVKTAYLYFDGIRIYDPIKVGSTERNDYLPGEATASFHTIREMILKGQAGVAKIQNGEFVFASALISYVEEAQPGLKFQYKGNTVSSLNDYLVAGPNNEAYFNSTTQTLVLYAKEDADAKTAPMLQIGIRNLNPDAFDNVDGDKSMAPEIALLGEIGKEVLLVSATDKAISYTEQYYTIDLSQCVVENIDGTDYYRVVISAKNSSAISLTNLKVSGLEFYTIPGSAATMGYDENGFLVENTATETEGMPNLYMVARQLRAAYNMLPEDELPGEAADLKFRSISLSLQSSIGMNMYVTKAALNGYADPFVRLTKTVYDAKGNASTITVDIRDYTEVQVQGQDCILFVYNDIAAKEMGSNVTMQLFATRSDIIHVMAGESRDYSVVQYAKNMLEKNVGMDSLNTLLVNMVNYGAQAQVYFNYNTANPANAGFEAYQHYATVAQPEMVSCTDKDSDNPLAPMPEGSTGYLTKIPGASLLLEDKVKVNIYVDVMDAKGRSNVGRTVMVAYADVTGTTVIEELIITDADLDKNGKYYKVNFHSLNATDMRTPFMAWVADENGVRISNTMTYSIESYGASVMSGTTATHLALKPLVVEMMKYGDSAKAFFGSSK